MASTAPVTTASSAAPVATVSPTAPSPTAGTSTDPSQNQVNAFQLALSQAMSAPNVLGGAGGDDGDEDDGSSLSVQMTGFAL